MRLFRKLRLLWAFYKNFFLISLIVDLLGAAILYKSGNSAFAPVFWLKSLTLGITFYVVDKYRYKEYYYYKNLGLPKRALWTTIAFCDLFIFMLLITQIQKFK